MKERTTCSQTQTFAVSFLPFAIQTHLT